MVETLIQQFILATIGTVGISIIFKVPPKQLVICSFVGGLAWFIYKLALAYSLSPVAAFFLASCVAALFSDIASKLLKEAATIFIIPGIICLVPGAGMYKTMFALLHHDPSEFMTIAIDTLMAAGAIAVGLLMTGAILKVTKLAANKVRTHIM